MAISRRSFLTLLVASLTAAACGPLRESANVPRFSVEPAEIDLGKCQYSKKVRAVFTVTNTGTAPLIMTVPRSVRLEEGCCPSRVIVGRTTLAPNQSTDIETSFTIPQGMGGPHLAVIDIRTNDPSKPLVNLKIKSHWGK